jgi:hypothetical protein
MYTARVLVPPRAKFSNLDDRYTIETPTPVVA